ncbi:MAG: hypothetical protein QW406_02765 [Ignisphaera sp.]
MLFKLFRNVYAVADPSVIYIAMVGGFSNEHQIVKAIALSGFDGEPYVKAIAMARAPLLAVMKARYFQDLAARNALPPDFTRRCGAKPE